MADGKPIFYDEERRRWRRTRRVLEISGAVLTFIVVVFLINVFRKPVLPNLIPETRYTLHAIHTRKPAKLVTVRQGRHKRVASLGNVPDHYDPLRAAFYENGDPSGFASFQQHYKEIDLLIPEALQCISADGRLDVDLDPKLADWFRTTGVEIPVMPLLQNSDGTIWHVKEMAAMLAHQPARSRLIQSLAQYAVSQRDPGIVLDIEQVPDASQGDFRRFVEELAAAMHARSLKLMVALPAADWAYDYKDVARPHRCARLVPAEPHEDSRACAPTEAGHGHRQLRLRLAGEITSCSPSRGLFAQL